MDKIDLVVSLFEKSGRIVTEDVEITKFENTADVVELIDELATNLYLNAEEDGRIHIGLDFKGYRIDVDFEYIESDYASFDFDLEGATNYILEKLNETVLIK